MERNKIEELRNNVPSSSTQEVCNPLNSNTDDFDENRVVSKTVKKENMLSRFYRRRIKSVRERRLAYRPMVESIDEDTEADHSTSNMHKNTNRVKANSSKSKSEKKRRIKLKEKSATFDYADLKNEIDFPPRINVRRTAICAKSKSADALQLETFIVVSRLKQFDLI